MTGTKLQRILAALLLLTVGSISLDAQKKAETSKPVFTSVYTDMKRDCKPLPEPPDAPEGVDPLVACKGYGGHRILISYSAWGAGLRVEGLKKADDAIPLGEDYGGYGSKGEKVEWRMADGKPFALIIRIGKYRVNDEGGDPFAEANRTGSKLVIKGLKGWEHIDFEVDGSTPNANAKAREMVDQNYSKGGKVVSRQSPSHSQLSLFQLPVYEAQLPPVRVSSLNLMERRNMRCGQSFSDCS